MEPKWVSCPWFTQTYLGTAKCLQLWTLQVRNSAWPNGNAGIPATAPPPFLLQLPLDDSGLRPVDSFPWKCIGSSHHICSSLKTHSRSSLNPRIPQEASTISVSSLTQGPEPLLTVPHTLPRPPHSHRADFQLSPSSLLLEGSTWTPLWGTLCPLDLLRPLITSSLFAPQGFCTSCFLDQKASPACCMIFSAFKCQHLSLLRGGFPDPPFLKTPHRRHSLPTGLLHLSYLLFYLHIVCCSSPPSAPLPGPHN